MAKVTVFLKSPVILRTKEPDPNGAVPVDINGAPLKDRQGKAIAPFRVVETTYKKGLNVMEDSHANHPYIKAHAAEGAEMAPEYTVGQLEELLAAAKAREAAKGNKAPVGKQNDGKSPLPWPNDDFISNMRPGDLRELLESHGVNSAPFQTPDALLNAVIDAKAKDAAKG